MLCYGSKITKPGYRFLPNQIVIKTSDEIADITEIEELNSIIDYSNGFDKSVVQLIHEDKIASKSIAKELGLFNILLVKTISDVDPDVFCRQMQSRDDILWCEPVYMIPSNAVPDDSLYTQQIHLPQIYMPEAWDIHKGNSSIIIGIIDTGVDWLHPDLVDQIWINPGEDIDNDGIITEIDSNDTDDDLNGFIDDFRGWDWVSGMAGTEDTDAAPFEDGDEEDNDPIDVDGHGTHCAGLCAAATDNTIGVASVSWGCKIMPLRIGWHSNDGNGIGLSTWMAQAFIYAADNSAKVSNLSFGNSAVVLDAAAYAFAKNVAITTSAGNSNSINMDPLSSVPWTLTVAAVDPFDVKTWYSNYGPHITISAPGGNHNPGLWSTTPNNSVNNNSYYNAFSGTSMASPVAAGLISIIRSQNPDWDAAKSYYQIAETADDIDYSNPNYRGQLGFGRVNGYRALTENVIPKANIILKYSEFSEINGNNNGIIEPGEEAKIVIHLENCWAGASDVTASIQSEDSRITMINSSVVFDTIYGLENFPFDNNNLTDPFIAEISDDSPPCRIPLSVYIESSSVSDTFYLDFPVRAEVLFVDDHLGGGDGVDMDIEQYFGEAFDSLGIIYEYRLNNIPIDSSYITRFPIVVWGCEWAFPSLVHSDRNLLSYYLEQGGNLFISGQDIGWDLCDLEANNNQCFLSDGASRVWYETYLSSEYLFDDINFDVIEGIDDQPLSAELSSPISEPGRDIQSQFPSVILPLDNAESVFRYPGDQIAATVQTNPFSTVYFAFGGFEAISDRNSRIETMKRIAEHFSKIKATYPDLKDTEESGPFPISTSIDTEKELESVTLWYIINQNSWNKIAMNSSDSNIFTAEIPSPASAPSVIEYRIIAIAGDGTYAPNPKYSFRVGPDEIPPVILPVGQLKNTVDASGPYRLSIKAYDNSMLDTTSAHIYFRQNLTEWDSVGMTYIGKQLFSGEFSFSNPIQDNDSVFYYFEIQDKASSPNSCRFPSSGDLSFQIVKRMIIDNFESDLSEWDSEEPWVLHSSAYVSEGEWCLKSSNSNYPSNCNSSIVYNTPINLSSRSTAVLKFIESHHFQDTGDSCLLEIREGTSQWNILTTFKGTEHSFWADQKIDITEYCGFENDKVDFRFRFVSDSLGDGDLGIFIDNIHLLVDDATQNINSWETLSHTLRLGKPFPNPFNTTISIPYEIPEAETISLSIYDLRGNLIYFDESQSHYQESYISWNGKDRHRNEVSSGVYIVVVNWKDYSKSFKIALIK